MKFSRIIAALAILVVFAACNKKEYLIDGGVHDPKTPLSTYDYLKQHPWQSFDTLVNLIDHYNMKDEVNQATTMFAFTDNTVKNYIAIRQSILNQTTINKVFTLDSLKKYITADSIRQYIFAEKIDLATAPLFPEMSLLGSKGNTTCGFSKSQLINSPHDFLQRTKTPVFALFYTSVKGAVDVPGVPPATGTGDVRVQCQTTGIETSSGTTLHVLVNQHTFARF